jgi:hypothetical protein
LINQVNQQFVTVCPATGPFYPVLPETYHYCLLGPTNADKLPWCKIIKIVRIYPVILLQVWQELVLPARVHLNSEIRPCISGIVQPFGGIYGSAGICTRRHYPALPVLKALKHKSV